MTKPSRRLPLLCIGMIALALAGCASTGEGPGVLGASPRPKSIVVSDFVFAPEVVAVDRGFTARLERKIGAFPTFERKQRTNERVNDEITATIVASLREAGLEAEPGSEDALSLKDDAVVVFGRLRASDPASAAVKNNQIGFGAGRSSVVADMTVSHFSSSGRKQLMAFTTEPQSGRKPAAVSAKLAAARNGAIASALAATNAAKEKLSPEVEAQARRIGTAVGDKIVAFAREQGWLQKAEGAEAAPAEEPTKLPAPKPGKKPAKPAAEQKRDAQDKPED